jgi:uncharacterized membrane protein
MEQLAPICLGVTEEMLEDLLTPDEQPEGRAYAKRRIRLASSFSVEPRRLQEKVARGRAQSSGVLIFHPVELLASDQWLLTCWHPTRTFSGAEEVEFAADGKPHSGDDLRAAIGNRWRESPCRTAGDLGVLVMGELALSYSAANWTLGRWLQDWELSLYLEDDLDNPDELKRLWGEMAVLRDWLSALNLPGLRADPDKAWLPVSQHDPVIEVDDRVDKTLDRLGKLSETMRSSFSILNVQQSEEERDRRESAQHRIELIAAIFLVPTLIVGFYGANTWVPGQGKHWGFWVMVAVLLIFSAAVIFLLLRWQAAQQAARKHEAVQRDRMHAELLRRQAGMATAQGVSSDPAGS